MCEPCVHTQYPLSLLTFLRTPGRHHYQRPMLQVRKLRFIQIHQFSKVTYPARRWQNWNLSLGLQTFPLKGSFEKASVAHGETLIMAANTEQKRPGYHLGRILRAG